MPSGPKATLMATARRHRTKPDPLAKVVGERIRNLRKQQDFRFDAFVEETGLGRGYVSELERGLVVPSIHSLSKVARALGLTLADIVLGDSRREAFFEATRGISDEDVEQLFALLATLKAKAGT